MTPVWNPIGAFTTAVALLAWALAAVVYAMRPGRWQNRFLALALFFEGLYLAGGTGLIYLTDDPASVFAFQMLNIVGGMGFVASYLLLMGALATPLAAPLSSTPGRMVILGALATGWVCALLRPTWFVTGVGPTDVAVLDAVTGAAWGWLRLIDAVVLTAAVVLAADAWRRAPRGTLTRTQAGVFLAAFGVRDVLGVLVYSVIAFNRFVGTDLASPVWTLSDLLGFHAAYWFPLHVLVFVVLLTYGILKAQLFDIDLRVKWTLSRTTVAAAFVAAFFVVSELVAGLLSDQVGLVAGVLATGALVFALAPLQRVADRVADRAMPDVHDTEEYRLVRKRQVYQAAVASALEDGELTERERDILATLAQELGLGAADARAIERDVARPRRAGGAA